MEQREVVVIGAGPAGALAATLLKRAGHDVLVLEREQFPRFSIGESLLPQSMAYLDAAGMMDAVRAAGFQRKTGAAFAWGERRTAFDFRDKFSPGPGTTYQVQRAVFDKVLADEAERQGVTVRYRQQVTAVDFSAAQPVLEVLSGDGTSASIQAQFVLDASGYGRVLARLCDLERPSTMAPRRALFTHIEDHIRADAADPDGKPAFDREQILITVHPDQPDVWFWLIPFSGGRASLGVVGPDALFESAAADPMSALRAFIDATPSLAGLLGEAVFDTPARMIGGYSASVTRLHGNGFALLGNAAEFLDPVFSSGVTIALRSAQLAAQALHRQLSGASVDWETEFAAPLMVGVNCFREYVQGWYDGTFRDVVFFERAEPGVRGMISAILAGYAWDTDNPFVTQPRRRLRMLAELCAPRP
jgi:flavin-dependent dehydrogenase